LHGWANAIGLPLYTALQVLAAQQGERSMDNIEHLERHPVGARQAAALVEFLELLDDLIEVGEKNNISILIDGLLERTAYRKYLFATEEEPDAEERWQNVEELRNVAAEYEGLADNAGLVQFLEDVALISDADTIKDEEDSGGSVTLITLHSAKGLEYPVVFMIAMEEGVLPHARSYDDPAQMEEERRLAYVGMTRAKERLYLLRAFRRYAGGMSQHNPPSRFLRDIPPEVASAKSAVSDDEAPDRRGSLRYAEPPQERDYQPLTPEDASFSGGERVRHPRFGEGIVVGCVVKGDDQEVTVAFKGETGIKKLMLSFAPLERL
jgi:DNA helicase-2/ATP-dependent DNA helicase PcrA